MIGQVVELAFWHTEVVPASVRLLRSLGARDVAAFVRNPLDLRETFARWGGDDARVRWTVDPRARLVLFQSPEYAREAELRRWIARFDPSARLLFGCHNLGRCRDHSRAVRFHWFLAPPSVLPYAFGPEVARRALESRAPIGGRRPLELVVPGRYSTRRRRYDALRELPENVSLTFFGEGTARLVADLRPRRVRACHGAFATMLEALLRADAIGVFPARPRLAAKMTSAVSLALALATPIVAVRATLGPQLPFPLVDVREVDALDAVGDDVRARMRAWRDRHYAAGVAALRAALNATLDGAPPVGRVGVDGA